MQIKFFLKSVEDRAKSIEHGRYMAKDVEFVKVFGDDNKNCIEVPYSEYVSNIRQKAQKGMRFSDRHTFDDVLMQVEKKHEAWRKGIAIPEFGTSVRAWGFLSPAQTENVINAGILTVEELADANENAMSRIGMGARELVKKAKAWLEGANAQERIQEIEGKLAALASENAALKLEIARLKEKKPASRAKKQEVDAPRAT